MKYAVELNIRIEGSLLNCSNTFYCGQSVLAPKVANWVKEIKWETGYRETKIESIMVNKDFDITEEVIGWNNPFIEQWTPF